ncbi:MAG TPA: luciferase family protein [Candidatus Dormibacteraeota bacterium]|nr:luciferase family protein [Candidatus Dormibacteraeota bacterium]
MVDRNELLESLKAWILQLPGVTQEAHRFGGTEFQVEGLEFMHHHGPSFLDIRLSKSDQEKELKNGTALPHRFAPQAGWVSFRIEKPEDLEAAKRLIRLAYENARTSMEAHSARRSQMKLG